MRKKINIIISICLLLLVSCQQVSDIEQLKKDVYYLADDKLEGRGVGTKGEKLAVDYIISRYEKIGLEPKGVEGYKQTFKSNLKGFHGENLDEEVEISNVIGFIDNKADNTIVIGAHFDHLGWGGRSSLHQGEKEIHHGADDNASGVAVMLSLAKKLKDKKNGNNFLIIAFTGEEEGLWGSNYFTKNPTVDLKKVNYMINLDMVGRLNNSKDLAIYGTGTSSAWDEILEKVSNKDIKYIKKESGVGPSDYTSFYLKDIPVLHFFTGQHEDYHKPSDTPEKLNYEGMVEISSIIENIINITDKRDKLDFQKTKDDDARNKFKFNVTLGVIPDYMFSGEGMKVDGVKEDRPAKKAGIQKGDIIVKMGDYEVKDMKGYMEALSKFKKGDKVNVSVNRDEKIIEVEVIF